ncbi:MAG: hypothetical protein IKA05_07415 [Clostridia bacterium]|nr:hypothetical protein [Clostridia bacterium]
MHIPQKYRDLRRYARARTLRRILGFLIWMAVWIGSVVSYNLNHQTYPAHRRFVGWRLALVLAVALLSGVVVFRLWKLFSDRTLWGVIERSGLSRSYTVSNDPGASRTDYEFRLNTALVIRRENGRTKRLRFEQKEGFYHYYREGHRVVRFGGLPYPLLLDANAPHGYVCSACGAWQKDYVPQCAGCGYSLIDPKDLTDTSL